jgi:TRAP transporter TAXI family solute receptor
MITPRPNVLLLTALIALLMFTASCGHVQSAGSDQPPTIRISTGFRSGNFRPFSEALAKGYGRLIPDVRIQQVDTSGSLDNIQGLEDGAIDIGLSQAGIAYMAYNGRLRESAQPMRGIRGIAILNSSAVQLLVGPRSRIRSIDELIGRRVGVGPADSGAAVISHALLNGYFSSGDVHEVNASVPETTSMLLDAAIDAAFTVSSVPNEDVKHMTEAGARLIPIRGHRVDRLRTMYPFFRSEIIPAGAYRGMDQPVHTLSVDVVLLARAGLDDAIVRRLADGLFRMLPLLNAELPFLKGMVPERAAATPVPLHPGAALYYRERELRR